MKDGSDVILTFCHKVGELVQLNSPSIIPYCDKSCDAIVNCSRAKVLRESDELK